MNENIERLGANALLLNYIDHETPRHYFVAHWADQEEVEKYTESVILEILTLMPEELAPVDRLQFAHKALAHFGFELSEEKV